MVNKHMQNRLISPELREMQIKTFFVKHTGKILNDS